MSDSEEKGIISRKPVIKCRKIYINENTVSIDGELMGYVTKLTIESDKPYVTVERLLPVKNGKNGKNGVKNGDTKKYEKVVQTIIVEKKK